MDNQETAVCQNLEDAGCCDEFVEQFMQVCKAGKTEAQLRLLSKQRVDLLDTIRDYQKKLDCLDYLIYKIKKENIGKA
jgi:hypothetical protein